VATRAQAFCLTRIDNPTPNTTGLLGPDPVFHHDYAMGTDLTQPVIVAQLLIDDRPPSPLLIDGHPPAVPGLAQRRPAACPRTCTPSPEGRQVQQDLRLGPAATWHTPR